MSSRKNPSTSLDAYRALTPEKLNGDYRKIIDALQILGSGTYEQISDYIQCKEPNVVSRRLKEMEGMELIWKPGAKKLTKRGRAAYIYQLTGNFAKTDNQFPPELSKNIPHASIQPQQDSKTILSQSSMFD